LDGAGAVTRRPSDFNFYIEHACMLEVNTIGKNLLSFLMLHRNQSQNRSRFSFLPGATLKGQCYEMVVEVRP
jgi:hypothetical protein